MAPSEHTPAPAAGELLGPEERYRLLVEISAEANSQI
jgi:hypothetical protein